MSLKYEPASVPQVYTASYLLTISGQYLVAVLFPETGNPKP